MLVGMTLTTRYSCEHDADALSACIATDHPYSMVFHWVFIPWLQVELNNYQDRINNSRKCRDRRKVRPWQYVLLHLLTNSGWRRFCPTGSWNLYTVLQKITEH